MLSACRSSPALLCTCPRQHWSVTAVVGLHLLCGLGPAVYICETSQFFFFLSFFCFLFILCMSVLLHICVYVPHTWWLEIRRGHQALWNWNYGWLWATRWVLSTRATSTFNCWVISPALTAQFLFLVSINVLSAFSLERTECSSPPSHSSPSAIVITSPPVDQLGSLWRFPAATTSACGTVDPYLGKYEQSFESDHP